MLFLYFRVLTVFWLNPWSARGVSHHAAFMGNWPTIIHGFLALSIQWMSSPSRKWGLGVTPRFHLVVNQVVNQGVWCKSREMGEPKSLRFTNDGGLLHHSSRPSSYRKFLDRFAFRILLNINDGVHL